MLSNKIFIICSYLNLNQLTGNKSFGSSVALATCQTTWLVAIVLNNIDYRIFTLFQKMLLDRIHLK